MRTAASIVFYPMFWLRGLALGFLKIVGGLLTLAFIVMFFLKAFDRRAAGSSGVMSDVSWYGVVAAALPGFFCFLLSQWYDAILLRLNPTGHELELYQ